MKSPWYNFSISLSLGPYFVLKFWTLQFNKLEPDFFNNRLYLAENYIDIGQKNKAKEQLEWMVKRDPKPEHRIEDIGYKEKGIEILGKYF